MEHHDWEWSDDGGHGDAETADLSGGDDLGHAEGFTDFGDHDLGGGDGHEFGGGQDDLGGQHLSADSLDEPLGTENAVGAYDADIADHGADYGHDDDLGHTADAEDHAGVPAEPANPHDPGADLPADHPADPTGGHLADPTGHGADADAHGAAADPAGHGAAADPAGHGAAVDAGAHDGQPDPADHTGDPGPHADPAAGDHTDPGDHPLEVNDGHGDATGDHLVGVDPDLDHRADDPGWHDDPFPPELHLDATPEPVDGFPWVDPATLGGHEIDDYTHVTSGDGGLDAHDLAQYNGIEVPAGSDPWTALFGAEDPATSSLAQWWAPNG